MPPITAASPVTFADPLPDAVDVVVIGGGIGGIASAYFLAERGVSVLVCEKGRVAGEQSSRNWGWIRQQGRDPAELPIVMEANRIWRGLAEATGEADLAFTESGCCVLTDDPARQQGYEAWHEVAVQHQLDTRLLSKAEIAERFPAIGGDFVGGMLTRTDGRAEPAVAVPALARAAQCLGATIIEDCAVRTLDIAGGKVAGAVTERGRVRAERVLLAGGAWSSHFAANAGVDLPQLAVRSTAARTGPAPDVYAHNFGTPGLTLRRRADGGYTISTGDVAEHYLSTDSFRYATKFLRLLKASSRDVRLRPAAPTGYPGAWGTARRWTGGEESPYERQRVLNPEPSALVVRRIEERLPARFPALKEAGLAEAWAGMIDVTPDAVPTLGEDDRLKGLFIATGFSGHGFGIGPGVGRIMADLLQERPPGHDLTRFRPQRFFDGSPIVPGPY